MCVCLSAVSAWLLFLTALCVLGWTPLLKMSLKPLNILRNFHVAYLKGCVFDLSSFGQKPCQIPFLVDGFLYKRSVLCRLNEVFQDSFIAVGLEFAVISFLPQTCSIRVRCFIMCRSHFEKYVSCVVLIFLRFEVVVQLLSQLLVFVSAICWVWQTFLQASDFFPAIHNECIFLVEWFRNLEISEFPFDFFEPVVPRFSFDYRVIPWDKWLRFQISRCRDNLHWSCCAGICLFCVRHVLSIDRFTR